MKFTEEATSLCKQVAEKYRKKIKYGCWFEFKGDILLQKSMHHPEMSDRCIPLWTISDCLEFLGKKGYAGRIDFGEVYTRIYIFGPGLHSINWTDYPNYRGETPLEACLKAVLAVLEEK